MAEGLTPAHLLVGFLPRLGWGRMGSGPEWAKAAGLHGSKDKQEGGGQAGTDSRLAC